MGSTVDNTSVRRYESYVLLSFPVSILHDIDSQQHSLLHIFSHELLLIIFKSLPLVDRIKIALTAKRYLIFTAAEGLLRINEQDLGIAKICGRSHPILRIASPLCWINHDTDTDYARRDQEAYIMRRLVPYLMENTTVNTRIWRLRVKRMVTRIGGTPTRGLLDCIENRAYNMYSVGLNGYWWHADIDMEDDKQFVPRAKVESPWISGLPWRNAAWDEDYKEWT